MHECLELIIRLTFIVLKFIPEHPLLFLAIILFFLSLGKILGLIGYLVNLAGIVDGPLPFIDIFTIPLQGMIWAGIIIQAPIIIPLKIIFAPLFFITGFIWDALGTIFPFLNFIPLTLLIALLINQRGINYVVLGIPIYLFGAILLTGFPYVCSALNTVISLFA